MADYPGQNPEISLGISATGNFLRSKDFPKQVFNRPATLNNIKLVFFCFALLHCYVLYFFFMYNIQWTFFCLQIFTNVTTSLRSKHFPGSFSYKELTKFSSSDHFSAYWLMINTLKCQKSFSLCLTLSLQAITISGNSGSPLNITCLYSSLRNMETITYVRFQFTKSFINSSLLPEENG